MVDKAVLRHIVGDDFGGLDRIVQRVLDELPASPNPDRATLCLLAARYFWEKDGKTRHRDNSPDYVLATFIEWVRLVASALEKGAPAATRQYLVEFALNPPEAP